MSHKTQTLIFGLVALVCLDSALLVLISKRALEFKTDAEKFGSANNFHKRQLYRAVKLMTPDQLRTLTKALDADDVFDNIVKDF